MLRFLNDKNFAKNSQVLGIHCQFQSNESNLFYIVHIRRKGGKLNIEKFHTIQGDVEHLAQKLPRNVPVFLSIDGKGVLNKKISIKTHKIAVNQVIPNASVEDFLVNQYLGANEMAFVSVARKDFVNDLLDRFILQNLQVIGLAIGPFSIVNILSIFKHLPTAVISGGYQIFIDTVNCQIVDFIKAEENQNHIQYPIGSQTLPSEYLLSYCQALSYYLPVERDNVCQIVQDQYEEFTSKKIFSLVGRISMFLLLLILTINVLYFSKYSNEKYLLENAVVGNSELLGKLKVLKEELAWKEKFLNQSGIFKNIRMSYYADQIAQKVPDEVTLESLDIYPLVSKLKKNKELELQPFKINIEGNALNSFVLNDWVHILKEMQWVDDVVVVNYSKNENSDTGIFFIELKIKK